MSLGQEQHDEIRRLLELVVVRLAAQARDVLAHLPRVIGEEPLARFVVVGFHRVQVGEERHLGIDHDVAAAGQMHHEVGTQAAVLAGHAHLLGEIAMREHARHLDRAAQLQLAPAAARGRLPQRLDEIARLATQVHLSLLQRPAPWSAASRRRLRAPSRCR